MWESAFSWGRRPTRGPRVKFRGKVWNWYLHKVLLAGSGFISTCRGGKKKLLGKKHSDSQDHWKSIHLHIPNLGAEKNSNSNKNVLQTKSWPNTPKFAPLPQLSDSPRKPLATQKWGRKFMVLPTLADLSLCQLWGTAVTECGLWAESWPPCEAFLDLPSGFPWPVHVDASPRRTHAHCLAQPVFPPLEHIVLSLFISVSW